MPWVCAETGFDELFERPGVARPHDRPLLSILEPMSERDVARRERLQRVSLVDRGITFAVYGERSGVERALDGAVFREQPERHRGERR